MIKQKCRAAARKARDEKARLERLHRWLVRAVQRQVGCNAGIGEEIAKRAETDGLTYKTPPEEIEDFYAKIRFTLHPDAWYL